MGLLRRATERYYMNNKNDNKRMDWIDSQTLKMYENAIEAKKQSVKFIYFIHNWFDTFVFSFQS